MRKKILNTKKGFTLIELLVAIGIVSILAAAILISMKSFAAKGRASKALGQLSSAIPAMYSCWGNGGDVAPSPKPLEGGGQICSISSSYGNWPSVGVGDMKDYYYGESAPALEKDAWVLALINGIDEKVICCNSQMRSCKILDNWYGGGTWPPNYCHETYPSN